MQLIAEVTAPDSDADVLIHEAEAIVHDAFVALCTRAARGTRIAPGFRRPTVVVRSQSAHAAGGRDRSSVAPWARSPPTHDV